MLRAAEQGQHHTSVIRAQVLHQFVTSVCHRENRTMLSYLLRWQAAAIGTSWHRQHSENTKKERQMRHTHAVPCFVRAAHRWRLLWQRYGWDMLLRNVESSFERYGQLQSAATVIARRWRQRETLMLCRVFARWRSNTSFSVSTHRQYQACHMMRSVALRWSRSALLWGWQTLCTTLRSRQSKLEVRAAFLGRALQLLDDAQSRLMSHFILRWRLHAYDSSWRLEVEHGLKVERRRNLACSTLLQYVRGSAGVYGGTWHQIQKLHISAVN